MLYSYLYIASFTICFLYLCVPEEFNNVLFSLLLLISTIYYYLLKLASFTLIYKAFDVRGIFRKKNQFLWLHVFKAL